MKDHVTLQPYDIRFTQNSISNKIRWKINGKLQNVLLGTILDDLIDGKLSISSMPKISVFQTGNYDFYNPNHEPKWFSWDNRRLWLFHRLQDYFDMHTLNPFFNIVCLRAPPPIVMKVCGLYINCQIKISNHIIVSRLSV